MKYAHTSAESAGRTPTSHAVPTSSSPSPPPSRWTPAAAAAAAPSPSPPRAVPAWPAGGPVPAVTPPSSGHSPAATPFAAWVAGAPAPPAPTTLPPPPAAAVAAVARASADLDRKARVFVDDAAFLAEIGTGRALPPPGLDVRAAIVELGARFTRFEAAFRAELATAAGALGVSLAEASGGDDGGMQASTGVLAVPGQASTGVLAVPGQLAPVRTARPASPSFFRRRPGSGSLWKRRTTPRAAPTPGHVTLVRPASSGGPVVLEVAPGVVVRTDLPPPADDSPAGTPEGGRATTPRGERPASVWRRLSKGGGAGTPSGPAVPTLSMPNKFAGRGHVGGVIPGFGSGGVGGLAAHWPPPAGANQPAW